MNKNRYISAIYKALLCLGSLAGILIQLGIFNGRCDLAVLRYYTLLSNVACTAYFGIASVMTFLGREKFLPRFKGALIMGITVTGMVYHFMLSGMMFKMGSAQAAANILLHYVTPILSVLDWVLFDKKGSYGWLYPIMWTSLPDVYFVLATIYGFAFGSRLPFYGGSRFPYFFIDYDVLGLWGVIVYVIVLNVAFIALGYVFVLADFGAARLRDRPRTKKA